jgi:DNA (cytosine-5)-methyltransferase 1
VTVGSLFAGIGGFDLGFERAGFEIKWQVEIDPFCRAVLAKHWPAVKRYDDVFEVMGDAEELQLQHIASAGIDNARLSSARPVSPERAVSRRVHRLASVDVVCGGFPCQPHSLAGRRGGSQDERDLWPAFARLIRELRPRWVVAENVPGLLSSDAGRFFGTVLGDLAACGYDAEWDCLPAAAFGAPHRRDRVWIVAYPNGRGYIRHDSEQSTERGEFRDEARRDTRAVCAVARAADVAYSSDERRLQSAQGRSEQGQGQRPRNNGAVADADDTGREQQRRIFTIRPELSATKCGSWWRVEPDVGRVAHGIPARVDRLRGLGNAVVPQIAEWIARQILQAEEGCVK